MVFGTDFETYQCLIELEQGTDLQRQVVTAPKFVIIQQILEIAQAICNKKTPCRCKVSRTVPIYSRFDKQWFNREYSIEFKNKAYENK